MASFISTATAKAGYAAGGFTSVLGKWLSGSTTAKDNPPATYYGAIYPYMGLGYASYSAIDGTKVSINKTTYSGQYLYYLGDKSRLP